MTANAGPERSAVVPELSTSPTSFLGRREDVAEVIELVARAGLVTGGALA